MCFRSDTKIKLLDGTSKTLKWLAENKHEDEFWVYSYDIEGKKVVPGLAHHPRITGRNEDVVKVTFENGSFVYCTPDHLFLSTSGEYVEAKDLVGVSVEGLYINDLEGILPDESEKFNHKCVSIENIGKEDVYDLTVYSHHNVLLDLGDGNHVFAHQSEYEEMNSYAEIGSALDIIADTGTQENEDGYRIKIGSKNEDLKGALDDLIHVTLGYDTKLWKVFRTTCMYGDCFEELILSKDRDSVMGTKWLPPKTMYRIEEEGRLRGFIQEVPQGEAVKFMPFEMIHFKVDGTISTFNPYGFSVLEEARRTWRQLKLMEDAMVVYRVSRAPERRVFKIWTGMLPPAPAADHVEQQRRLYRKRDFIRQTTGQFDSRANSIAPDEDFWVPMRNNQEGTTIDTLPGACLSLDTEIPLLDGRTLPLSSIITEYKQGKENWVYSIDPKTGGSTVSPITWAGVTRKNTDVVKITLDNGESIICTPDHKFPTRSNGKVEAKDLEGKSLFHYEKGYGKIKSSGNDYEMVWNTKTQQWEYTHRLVSKAIPLETFVYEKCEVANTIHHKNFDRFNNNPSNLVWMDNKDHWKYHSLLLSTERAREIGANGRAAFTVKMKSDEDFARRIKEAQSQSRKRWHDNMTPNEKASFSKKISEGILSLPESERKKWNDRLKINSRKGTEALRELLSDPLYKEQFYNKVSLGIKRKLDSDTDYRKKLAEHCKNISSKDWGNGTTQFDNKLMETVVNLYKGGFIKYKSLIYKVNKDENFITHFREINQVNNSQPNNKVNTNKFQTQHLFKMLKHFGYDGWRDFRNKIDMYNHKVVSVEILESKMDTGTITVDGPEMYNNFHTFALATGVFTYNSNLDQIADVKYFKDKIFAALKIPRIYLQDPDGGGTPRERANLAQQDIHFSRTIERIQSQVEEGIKKICMVHLLLRGYKKEEVDDFSIELTAPSDLAERLKLEVSQAKLQQVREMVEMGFSRMYIAKKFFDISNEEWAEMLPVSKAEKSFMEDMEGSAQDPYNPKEESEEGPPEEPESKSELIPFESKQHLYKRFLSEGELDGADIDKRSNVIKNNKKVLAETWTNILEQKQKEKEKRGKDE